MRDIASPACVPTRGPLIVSPKRDLLKLFVRELVAVHRMAARNRDLIAAVAPKYVKVADTSLLPLIARTYVGAGLWPLDGAFTPQAVARTVQFFVDMGWIRPGLSASQIGEYTLIREVLDELSPRP